MATPTTLNMTLLVRRGNFADSYVLQAGEPGYHLTDKTFKVGDGSTQWKDLPFANQTQIQNLILAGVAEAQAYADKIDTGVMSVSGVENNAVKVDNTDPKNPVVSLALDNSGNVQLSQSGTGLRANIDLSSFELSDTTYQLNYDSALRQIQLINEDTKGIASFIDASDFIKDGMIKSVEYEDVDDKGTTGKFLKITWNTPDLDDEDIVTYVNISDLFNVYTAGEGLTLNENEFSHGATSTVQNVTKQARTYIAGLTFDKFGHVTGVETGAETDQDVGITEVVGGTDITVTEENGVATVAHNEYQTGTLKDVSHDSSTDPSFITSVTINNGHVTGATVKNLKEVLESMTFILDGGTVTAD